MHVAVSQLLKPAGLSRSAVTFAGHQASPTSAISTAVNHAGESALVAKHRTCGRRSSQSRSCLHPHSASSQCRHRRLSLACTAASPRRQQVDTAMIWGDILMLTATNLASERLPKHLTGVLSLTLLAAWIGVSAAKGDYTMKQSRTFSFQYVYSVVFGMQQAAITWLLFVPTAMAMYACLVSHHLLDSGVFRVPPGARVSPEGEVMIAALFTLMSWRGIYSSQLF